jgi:hypothetical protein
MDYSNCGRFPQMIINKAGTPELLFQTIIHSFYLAFILATTVTLEQVTSLNTSFVKSSCPNAQRIKICQQ